MPFRLIGQHFPVFGADSQHRGVAENTLTAPGFAGASRRALRTPVADQAANELSANHDAAPLARAAQKVVKT